MGVAAGSQHARVFEQEETLMLQELSSFGTVINHCFSKNICVGLLLPCSCSINTLDDESSATTGIRAPWQPK